MLLFVAMTAPLGFVYAIPVEMWFPLSVAQTINVWFLAIVAIWRVALLIKYLMKSAGLSGVYVLVAALLPLTLIVTLLTALNLEHVVFRIMAGLKEEEKSANDAAYLVLAIITYFSILASPILLSLYGWFIFKRRKNVI